MIDLFVCGIYIIKNWRKYCFERYIDNWTIVDLENKSVSGIFILKNRTQFRWF